MKKTIIALIFTTLALSSTIANAADIGISADLGTTGAGIHFSIPISSSIDARLGINDFNYSYSAGTSSVNYNFKLKLNTFDALLDWYPFTSGFRLTGGVVYNDNQITATGQANSNGTYTINNNTYSATTAGSLNGNISFRKVAPYLGIGYGGSLVQKGWGFSGDLGVLFQGSPSTTLTNSGCTAAAATCSSLASDVAAENANLNNKVHNFNLYPVIRFGVIYRF